MSIKGRILLILHRSPPYHGASQMGDFITESAKLHKEYDCEYITIKSSGSIETIGLFSLKKMYYFFELYVQVLRVLISFRPDKIYFTASSKGLAFYRDLALSTLWKGYCFFRETVIYYHYHTKGVNRFISGSPVKRILTRFFLKNVNLVLLDPLLKNDFDKVKTYNQIFFLPNGVKDALAMEDFDSYISRKYTKLSKVNVLYLAHMMRDKGYEKVLELAQQTKGQNIHYHFAGSWGSLKDEDIFNNYIAKYNLGNYITYHGFVRGVQKHNLF